VLGVGAQGNWICSQCGSAKADSSAYCCGAGANGSLFTVKLPPIGHGIREAQIIRWRAQLGEPIALNAALLEISTPAADIEVPSPLAGVVKEIWFAPGTRISVGTTIAVIRDAASENAASKSVNDVAGNFKNRRATRHVGPNQASRAAARTALLTRIREFPTTMTIDKLGYALLAAGAALFLWASEWRRYDSTASPDTGMYAGLVVFLVGVGLIAFELNSRR
jgi:hypothetical protein